MKYYLGRRIAVFLGAGAVLGVPTGLYAGQYLYYLNDLLTLWAAGALAAVLLAFAIFAAKPSNNTPQMALNVLRMLAAILAVTLVGAIGLFASSFAAPNTAAEQEAVAAKYTGWVNVNGCTPIGRTTRSVALALSVSGGSCLAVLPIDRYSVVAVPDGNTATLTSMRVQANTNTQSLMLTFPVDGTVDIFVYDDGAAKYAAKRPAWTLPGMGLSTYTAISSRYNN